MRPFSSLKVSGRKSFGRLTRRSRIASVIGAFLRCRGFAEAIVCRMVGVENEAKLFRRKGNNARSGQMFAPQTLRLVVSPVGKGARSHYRPGSQRDKQWNSHSKRLCIFWRTRDGLYRSAVRINELARVVTSDARLRTHFHSAALPTELPGRKRRGKRESRRPDAK